MSDIVERLRSIDDDKMAYSPEAVRKLLCEAAGTIERLRSIAGKADAGPSFSELTSELRHQTPSDV
jgi:hypothetical protein